MSAPNPQYPLLFYHRVSSRRHDLGLQPTPISAYLVDSELRVRRLLSGFLGEPSFRCPEGPHASLEAFCAWLPVDMDFYVVDATGTLLACVRLIGSFTAEALYPPMYLDVSYPLRPGGSPKLKLDPYKVMRMGAARVIKHGPWDLVS